MKIKNEKPEKKLSPVQKAHDELICCVLTEVNRLKL